MEALKRLAYKVIKDAIVDANSDCDSTRAKAIKFLRGEIGCIRDWLDCLTGLNTDALMAGIKQAIDYGKIGKGKPRRVKQPTVNVPHSSKIMIRSGNRQVNLAAACVKAGIPYSTMYTSMRKNPGKDLDYLLSIGRSRGNSKVGATT